MSNGRFFLAYGVAVTVALAGGYLLFGGPAVLAVGVAAILALAARFDNHTGSCLLITIVLLVVIGILLSLLMLTASLAIH